jgi:hypothetical protein
MYQKVVLGVFLVLAGIILIDFFSNLFLIDFRYYLQSLFVLGLGIVVYPLDFKFKFKADYIFLTVIGLAIFNGINLFFLTDFSFKMNGINILGGISGSLLTIFRKKIK